MRARAYLFRVVLAFVAVGLLVGAVIGARAAVSATGTQGPVAQALAPVAVDGSISSDPGTVPENVVAPVSAPLPPQNAVLPGAPPTAVTPVPGTAVPGTAAPGTGAPTALAPDPAPVPRGSTVPAGLSPYSAWAASMSKLMDIPARALQAYGNAQNILAREQPGCRLSWTTLAGIAHIESNHGRFGGRALQPDGRPSSPIIGIPLDGGPNVQAIADTDGGVLDGDKVWDRAVGPFQFIPTTWAKWKADANGDGVADPQNIDDAAVAAGRYLCAGGRNLSDGASWWRAILSYNNSTAYVQDVFNGADSYARAALR
ncbi:MAG: murein transglycosylase [Mycobacteriaceae bacterium]